MQRNILVCLSLFFIIAPSQALWFYEDVDLGRRDPQQAVTMLHRSVFNTTISQENVDHWIVLFCADWADSCQALWYHYRSVAVRWEKTLNASAWDKTAVRFGEVDCARDKVLCNENLVEMYPTLVHFHDGKAVSVWSGDHVDSLSSLLSQPTTWIHTELLKAQLLPPSNHESVFPSPVEVYDMLFSAKYYVSFLMRIAVLVSMAGVMVWTVASGFEIQGLAGAKRLQRGPPKSSQSSNVGGRVHLAQNTIPWLVCGTIKL